MFHADRLSRALRTIVFGVALAACAVSSRNDEPVATVRQRDNAPAFPSAILTGADAGKGWTADPAHVVLAGNLPHLNSGSTPVVQGVSFLAYDSPSFPNNPQTTSNPTATLMGAPNGGGFGANWSFSPSVGSGSVNDQNLNQVLQ